MSASASSRPSDPEVLLATTTSIQDSGLLDVLLPVFEERTGYVVKPIAVGSGQALVLGERGEVDVLLVHSPDAEVAFIAAGHGVDRRLVMHNAFVLLGPPADPAGIKGARSAVEAFERIAQAGALFISRGDGSGTDVLEKKLWTRLGYVPLGQSWYQETGQGMGATLNVADEKRGYTLADHGTYLARKKGLTLEIMVEEDRALLNVYHVIRVNPDKSPRINAAGARAFADFMVAPDTQALIGEFGVNQFGEPLFIPDAGKREEALGE
ncbi:MAG: tungsten ABC transporter substrate-binding protein [Ardenticatenia bacterium]|nr:MAG: tungsten ABC transporter substrate-binding protein [Ardenticatenia bacterium]